MSEENKPSLPVCKICNGNDFDIPCAYTTEKPEGCLRAARLKQIETARAMLGVKMRVKWWLHVYLDGMIFFCTITGARPDFDKVNEMILRGIVVEVLGVRKSLYEISQMNKRSS